MTGMEKLTKFPVFFPDNRELYPGERFADDYKHRHLATGVHGMKKAFLFFTILIAFSLPFTAHAQSLDQLVQQLRENPGDATLRERAIKQAQEEKPAIPEEARKHFVGGTAIAKEAESEKQQALAAKKFQEAVNIAPWWGDAYYNLAVAQELAGNLDDAKESLDFYILTNPGEKETREAHDKIYALDAKKELAAAARAEKQEVKKAQEPKPVSDEDFINSLTGVRFSCGEINSSNIMGEERWITIDNGVIHDWKRVTWVNPEMASVYPVGMVEDGLTGATVTRSGRTFTRSGWNDSYAVSENQVVVTKSGSNPYTCHR